MSNRIKKSKGSMKKKIIGIIFLCAIGTICYLFCNMQKSIKTESMKIVEAMESSNIKMLENVLLGKKDFLEDDEWIEFSNSISDGNDGIITKIIEQSSIDVKKITRKYIVYEITVPELSGIFKEAMEEENLTNNNLEEYMYQYIAKAEKINTEVKVEYSYEKRVFKADYLRKEFLNAITGNLITAYQELIQEMIREREGENLQ